MKQQSIILITFALFCSVQLFSQSIRSLRTDTYDSYVPKFGKVQRIVNTNTFYNKTGPVIKKEIIEFSTNSDSIIEKRFEDNELNAELFFVFDSQKRLIYRTYKQKIPYSGWKSEIAEYSYDENGYNFIKNIDQYGNLLTLAMVMVDSVGNPISLILHDSIRKPIGYESAEYDYEKNTWTYRVKNSNGELTLEKTYTIDTKKSILRKYNENYDCILYPRNWNANDNTYYQVDYKYDKLGNWTKKTIYECQKIEGELKNKKIDRKFTRKIIYIKN